MYLISKMDKKILQDQVIINLLLGPIYVQHIRTNQCTCAASYMIALLREGQLCAGAQRKIAVFKFPMISVSVCE